MDLRAHIRSEQKLAEFEGIVASTDFIYQPFVIADHLEVGGGYEFIFNRIGDGFVHWEGSGPPVGSLVRSRLIAPEIADDFRLANAALRGVYEQWADAMARQAGDIGSKTVCDFGCFNGYIPVALALRGAKRAVGYDLFDRSACIAALNSVLGTNAEFAQCGYDLASGLIPGAEQFDIVSCMSIMQHMPEPMRFLNVLGSMTREALFLMTHVLTDDDLVMRFGEPNVIFPENRFPWCFDNGIYLSERLLHLALNLAGFHTIVPLHLEVDQRTLARAEQVKSVESTRPVRGEEGSIWKGALRGVSLIALRDGPSVPLQDMWRVHERGYRRQFTPWS